MSSTRFQEFIGVVLDFETEYNPDGTVRVERDPDDPGGTTKYGIDQRSHPGVNIAALTLEQAAEIYFGDWARGVCEELPRPLGELLFDIQQNGGPGAQWIQSAVGANPDGWIGARTLTAAAAVAGDPLRLKRAIDFICDQRELRFRRLVDNRPKSKKYLTGWIRRAEAMRRWAHAHPPLPAPPPAPVS